MGQGSDYWERLADRISSALGRPLVRTPCVPGVPHTFVEQIDRALQQRLAQMPDAPRSVHLRSRAGGGLEVEVDGQVYQGLAQVGDGAVRDLIRSLVDAWEHTGGGTRS